MVKAGPIANNATTENTAIETETGTAKETTNSTDTNDNNNNGDFNRTSIDGNGSVGREEVCDYDKLADILETFVTEFNKVEEKQNLMIDQVVNDTLKLAEGGSRKVIGHLDLLPPDYDKRQFPPRMDEGRTIEKKITGKHDFDRVSFLFQRV